MYNCEKPPLATIVYLVIAAKDENAQNYGAFGVWVVQVMPNYKQLEACMVSFYEKLIIWNKFKNELLFFFFLQNRKQFYIDSKPNFKLKNQF